MKSLFFVLPSATKVRELIFPPFPFRNFPGKKLSTPPAIGRMGAFFFRKQKSSSHLASQIFGKESESNSIEIFFRVRKKGG